MKTIMANYSALMSDPARFFILLGRIAEVVIGLLILLLIARVILLMIRKAGSKNDTLRPFIPTFSRVINVIFLAIGALIVLDAMGISITPMLATLGIGGLAVGLALQDTLANFFSGIYILFSQPVRVGDYVRLENGDNGYVRNIGWRETRIQTLPGNIIVVPNSKLSQMVVTNYYLPEKQMACLVQVGVSYDSDLAKVERVTNEVSRQVLKSVTGGVKNFEPFIRYHTFADFSINFTVILRVNEFVDKYLLTHEFIKALHKRYQEEGIEIPFPIRTVHMKKD